MTTQKAHMTNPDELPKNAYDLIRLLDKEYPHRCLRLNESVEEHQRYAGAREMIDGLVEWMKEELEGERND